MPEQQDKYIGNLIQQQRQAYKRLEHFRKYRKEVIDNYVGRMYGNRSAKDSRPYNFGYSAVSTLLPSTVCNHPAADITTGNPELRPSAYELQLVMDKRLYRMDARETMRRISTDAIFLIGIGRVGLAPVPVTMNGESFDSGDLYFRDVSFDNLVFDIHSTKFSNARWIGERYEMPLDQARDVLRNPDDLSVDSDLLERKNQKTARIGMDEHDVDDELEPKTRLVDLYLRAPNKIAGNVPVIITVSDKEGAKQILWVAEWHADDRGPFEFLSYMPVPDHAIGLSAAFAWNALDELQNIAGRKLQNRLAKDKRFWAYKNGEDPDAEKITAVQDGGTVGLNNPDAITAKEMNGKDRELMQIAGELGNVLDKESGNISLQGGTQDNAGTARMGMMLQSNSDKRLGDMSATTYEFLGRVAWKMGYLTWNDPMVKETVTIESAGVRTSVTVTQDNFQGDINELDISIKAHSMDQPNPKDRYQGIMEIVNGIILPTAHLGAASGDQLDVPELVELAAEAKGIVDMDRIYHPAAPMQVDPYRTAGRPSNNQIIKAPNQGGGGMTGGANQTMIPMAPLEQAAGMGGQQ